ncbi:unnamed protein product [Cochlearia groenlandica]
MGDELVFRSLTELFPQIDARLLKAVAIENPKDADEAAAVVISDIIPRFFPNLVDDSTQPRNKTPVISVPDNKGTCSFSMDVCSVTWTFFLYVRCLVGPFPRRLRPFSFQNLSCIGIYADELTVADADEGNLRNGVLAISETGASSSSGTIPLALDTDHEIRAPITESLSTTNQLRNVLPNGDLDVQSKDLSGLSGYIVSGAVSPDPEAESSTNVVSEDAMHKLTYPEDNSTITHKSSRFRFVYVSSDDEEEASSCPLAGDAELNGSSLVVVEETLKGSLAVENGDQELDGAFSSVVSRTTQGCNIDHLEQIIEDAKSNKRTLFTVMESIMNLMREVELQEKDAEKVKEEAARGGLDTLEKTEELKKILKHAKEANDMQAGEVYGERSILTTEVSELENRLLNLSEERDKSLSVLDEMRGTLETRLAAALEMKTLAEQEKQEKEGYARRAFAEQEAIMEKVVQESKLLKQEAEENSKLRDFLMDRGRIVDSLQGEISVICQDVLLLKEKFDNRVPLSQSITSSQTSCKLASSGSSMKSLLLEKPFEPSYETPGPSGSNNNSPKGSVHQGKDEGKELIEDGWDIFDKETEL